MQIDLDKTVFTSGETGFIVEKLQRASEKGFIAARTENNPYLLASFVGVEEKGISPKWNIKVYTFSKKKKGHSLVCVDKDVLGKLLSEDYAGFIPPDLEILRIDDAGWGFPLCGVMVGVSDEREVRTATVPVEFFKREGRRSFHTKQYLKEYAALAVRILDKFGATPETHRVEICTGYVNQPLREELRKLGYDVRVVEIKGMLQSQLERLYRAYVIEEVGADIYYDPKDMAKSEIPGRYRECLEYGRRHCPQKIKTGWRALEGEVG